MFFGQKLSATAERAGISHLLSETASNKRSLGVRRQPHHHGADIVWCRAAPSYTPIFFPVTPFLDGHRRSTHICMSIPYFAVTAQSPPAMYTKMTLIVHCMPTPTASIMGTAVPLAKADKAYCTRYLLAIAS